MKLNWGNGILIFYLTFVGALVFQLFQSFQYDNSLVVENYYEKDIQYQQQYDKLKNSQELSEPLHIEYQKDKNEVIITLPSTINKAAGRVKFYRANDKSKDFLVDFDIKDNEPIAIPTKDLALGEWTISVDWATATHAYFDEKIIKISKPISQNLKS